LIKIHEQIRKSGTHNYLGYKIPVQSGINVHLFREKLVDYHDNIICEFLEFGAPVGYEGEFVGSEFITKNHKGATDFSKEIEKYLKKKLQMVLSSDLSLRIHFVVILRFPL
jgi:hypothetical protein